MTSSDSAVEDTGTQAGRTQSLLPGYGVPDSITGDVVEFLTGLWRRGTLSMRDRQLVTLATLVALGTHEPLKLHVKTGLKHGLTKDEIYEAILHTGVYAGFGRSTDAFAVTKDVLAALPDPAEG